MRFLSFLFSLLFCFPLGLQADKRIKPWKEALKTGKQLTQALQDIQKAEGDSTFKDKVLLSQYVYWLNQKAYQMENEKLYLKQPYDTLKLFESLYRMYDVAQKIAKQESIPNAKGKVNIRFSTKNKEELQWLYPNLRVGSIYFFNKKNFPIAKRFLEAYLVQPQSQLFLKSKLQSQEPSQIAFLSLQANMQLGKYADALRFVDLSKSDTSFVDATLELASQAYLHLNDSDNFKQCLYEGLALYPQNPYYFNNLCDFYFAQNKNQQVLELCDSLLKQDAENKYYAFGKSLSLFKLHRYKDCLTFSLPLLQKDSTNAELYFNVGASYVSLAENQKGQKTNNLVEQRKVNQLQRDYYTKARPYVEQFRKLSPQLTQRWAPLLYLIYLHLNLEKEFEEIDNILKQ